MSLGKTLSLGKAAPDQLACHPAWLTLLSLIECVNGCVYVALAQRVSKMPYNVNGKRLFLLATDNPHPLGGVTARSLLSRTDSPQILSGASSSSRMG